MTTFLDSRIDPFYLMSTDSEPADCPKKGQLITEVRLADRAKMMAQKS